MDYIDIKITAKALKNTEDDLLIKHNNPATIKQCMDSIDIFCSHLFKLIAEQGRFW